MFGPLFEGYKARMSLTQRITTVTARSNGVKLGTSTGVKVLRAYIISFIYLNNNFFFKGLLR